MLIKTHTLFAAETFLSMDISSGSLTLDGPLMSTQSCGNFSSSTGYYHLLLFDFLFLISTQFIESSCGGLLI